MKKYIILLGSCCLLNSLEILFTREYLIMRFLVGSILGISIIFIIKELIVLYKNRQTKIENFYFSLLFFWNSYTI